MARTGTYLVFYSRRMLVSYDITVMDPWCSRTARVLWGGTDLIVDIRFLSIILRFSSSLKIGTAPPHSLRG